MRAIRDIKQLVEVVLESKRAKRELEMSIRDDEEQLMSELIKEGRVDCLNINWTRLKRL